MHMKLRIMVLLAGLGLVACATEPRVPTEIVLVRARIAALEDAGVENVANGPEEVDFASDSLVTLSIRQVLIGEVRDRKPVVVLRISAWPSNVRLRSFTSADNWNVLWRRWSGRSGPGAKLLTSPPGQQPCPLPAEERLESVLPHRLNA